MQFLCEPVCDLYVRCLLTYEIITFRLTAYGKVFLVRKRGGNFSGNLYAMKVLKKATIVQKAKTAEHTRTERQVLEAVRRCPFLVTLHWAFQTESKLHLIMGMFKHFWCLVRHMEIQLTPSRRLFYNLISSQHQQNHFCQAKHRFHAVVTSARSISVVISSGNSASIPSFIFTQNLHDLFPISKYNVLIFLGWNITLI